MFLARVTGHVVATQKDKTLSGQKLFVVEPLNVKYDEADKQPAALGNTGRAIVAIDAHGEAALRVQDVVRDAGVQIPVLYRHFGNREGLVQAAQLERLRRDLDAEMAAIRSMLVVASDVEEFREVLDRVLTRVISPERRQPRARRVNVLGSTYGRPELATAVAAAQQESVERIAALFEVPTERGWLRAGFDPTMFARWFVGAALGRAVVELDPDRVDMESYDRMWLESVHHMVFG